MNNSTELALHGLNQAQLAAVESPANVVQILAPPGSGKTKTLTARVAYLIQHHEYKPWNILCLTFTIKSSREMKERLAKLLGNGVEAKLILGTFHSVCRRYLVSYGHLIGLSKGFGIADSSDSLSIIKRIVKRMHFTLDPKAAQARISNSKSKGKGYPELSAEAAKKKKNVDQQEFAQVFEAYEDQLDQANLLDYDDLLLRCSDLLRRYPSCVSNVEAVLVDEFQDTNVVQFELMSLFAAHQKRITTVGDPDQSIYGWRSAEIKNLGRMQTQYPDTLVIKLQDNYRSSGAILIAAQEVIEQDPSRPAKALMPTHCPGTSPVLRRLPSSDVEALWIVSEVKRTIGMTGGMLGYPDFAILLRSAALSRQIESAMGKAGIPYRMVGGQRFFDRVEIKILLDYLRVISQSTNNDAVARILNVPARGIGPTTVKALLEEAESRKLTFWSFIRDAVQGNVKTSTKVNKPAEKGLGAFINIILTAKRKLTDTLEPMSPQSLLYHIISKLSFQDYLKRHYEIDHEGRWANVEELIAQAGDYPIAQGSESLGIAESDLLNLPVVDGIAQSKGAAGEEMLSMFLANVALATELQRDDEDDEGQNPSQVTISTIHAAKGLEWPVVFIPAAYEGSIPHSRAEDTDEERRLLYVAMTRAQALLYISCPVKNSQREESKLSQFLDPKTVGHYLVKCGANLNSGVVSDIARILRRPCPLDKEILELSSTLETREDDLWPVDGSIDPELMVSKWDSKGNKSSLDFHQQANQWSKPRPEASQHHGSSAFSTFSKSSIIVGSTTTMDSISSFSVQSFGGFTSATSQLLHLEHVQQIDQPSVDHGASIAGAQRKVKSRKRKMEGEAQSSLTSLWGLTAKPTRTEEQSELLPYKRRSTLLELDESDVKPSMALPSIDPPPGSKACRMVSRGSSVRLREDEPVLARVPLAAVPENLAKHGPGRTSKPPGPIITTIGQDQPDDTYVFLTSSPAAPGTASMRRPETGAKGRPETSDGGEHVASCEDLRPAVTLHATSMVQLHTTQSSRKTLGVRRSMGGWNSKSGQGFSVPRKAQK
ncbi:MAG: hypothetical protein Q9208_008768 [Pyrenodesmia sp. 3 TL-2023]